MKTQKKAIDYQKKKLSEFLQKFNDAKTSVKKKNLRQNVRNLMDFKSNIDARNFTQLPNSSNKKRKIPKRTLKKIPDLFDVSLYNNKKPQNHQKTPIKEEIPSKTHKFHPNQRKKLSYSNEKIEDIYKSLLEGNRFIDRLRNKHKKPPKRKK